MENQPLTLSYAIDLAAIIGAALEKKQVTRVLDDYLAVEGIARSIGDNRGVFIKENEDVRGSFLRVTTLAGLEVFWYVPDLVEALRKGTFYIHD